MIRILLYSTEPMLVAGLAELLGRHDGVPLAAACDTVAGLLEEGRRDTADVLLVESDASITPEVVDRLTECGMPPTILRTGVATTDFLAEAISSGVRGVLRKGLPTDALTDCVREVARGGLWVEKEL